MNNDFNKINIHEKIVVYKNALKETEDVLQLIKKLESSKEYIHGIRPMGNWWSSGLATGYEGPNPPVFEFEDENSELIKKVITNIYKVYQNVAEDYLETYKGTDGWPKYVKDWNHKNRNVWQHSAISFLKYDKRKHIYDPVNGIHDLAMHFHTDTNMTDLESPGKKLTITITIYLNDNYSGGEICFVDKKADKAFLYKPNAGDITVFPSGEPYLHGVFPHEGSDRYLVRLFYMYNVVVGSNEWHANEKKYGKEKWQKMEEERIKKFHKSPPLRQVVFPGEKPSDNFNGEIIYISQKPERIT
jgi:hypothetical protein